MSIRSHVACISNHRKLKGILNPAACHHQGIEQHQNTARAEKQPSRASSAVASGHRKDCCLIATDQTRRCASSVEKNLKMRTTCFGDAPQWEALRRETQASSRHDRLLWPPCTSGCGFFLEDPEAVAWADAGVSAQPLSIGCNTLPVTVLAECDTQNDDSVVAWTDGACVCKKDARFRTTCCGVFFSIDDDWNRSFTLPGREPTNNRAELSAAIAAMCVFMKETSRSGVTVSTWCVLLLDSCKV